MIISTIHQGYSQQQVPWPAKPVHSLGQLLTTLSRVATRLLVLIMALFSLTTASAQTKYTANFSTSPTFSYEGNQTYYKTRTTVSINGVNYLIHNAINADFTWTGSAVSYNPYSTVGLIIEREDQQTFNFYGIDLNYTSVNTELAHAPWLTVSYQGSNGSAASSDSYNETSKNFSVSKPAGVTVKSVQLYFADLATLVFDNLIVGPASGGTTCTNPDIPTVSATRSAVCIGESTTLSIQSGSLNSATDWKWYTGSCGGTLVGSGTSINVSPNSNTTYYVRGEGGCVTPGACTSKQITVNPLPSVNITPSTAAICAGQSVTLNATSGLTSYKWSTSATSNSITVSTAGPYSVTGTNSNGCSNTATANVTVNPLPTQFSMNGGGAYCAGSPGLIVGLSGSQSGVSYQLRLDDNAVGNPVNGTGSALNFGNQTTAGTYTVQATNTATSCQQNMSGSAIVTVNPLPTQFNVNGGGAYCIGGSGVGVGLSGSQSGINYQLLRGGSPVGMSMPGTGSALNFGNQTVGGNYTIQATNASTTCQQAMSGSVTVTVNPLPTPAIVGLAAAFCQDATPQSLSTTGNPSGGAFTIDGNPATSFNPASLSIGQHTVVYSYTNSNGCSNTTSTPVTVKAVPIAPTLGTISGQPYAAGVSSLTASVNTGSVSLTVSGCSDGTISWNGGNATTLAVSTANVGPQSFTATCTVNGCTSSIATATVVVVPTTLGVLYRDADYGNLTNNIIKPYLELSNASNDPIPYDQITLRYWFTAEGNASPTNLAVYYAPMGVTMKYVALPQPRQGAYGYVEYSFSGGNLGAQSIAGPIENGIQKSNNSNFNEADDYSYMANYQDFMPNAHITAYRNGVLFWGQEPALIQTQTAISVYSAAKDGTTTSQIQTRVEVRNEGNTPVTVSDLKLRYYFTSDNGQPANVYVDYADIGASNVQAQVVQFAAVSGADSYVELSFPGNTQTLSPQSSLGAIDFRIVRSDYGLMDQTNDYSYMANYGNVALNGHITAYLSTTLVFGAAPSGVSARAIAVEPTPVLQARVLGNPVTGSQALVEVKGVEGQSVKLKVVDLQGRPLHEQHIDQSGAIEQVSVPLGTSRGTLLLEVSVPGQRQQLKLLRP